MIINLDGQQLDISQKPFRRMALAYLNRKIELIYEKGEDSRAEPYIKLLKTVEGCV
jgi:hypothetical protein